MTASAGLLFAMTLAGAASAQAQVTLSYFIDDNPTNVATAEGLKAAFEAENPDIKIEIETRPGGGEGDNLVKTRLATGEMADVFLYNAGSLFQAINPPQNLARPDRRAVPGQCHRLASSRWSPAPTVTSMACPIGAAMGGGILYNKKIYADLGLSVPKTWAEFMANNEKIKAAGKVAGDPDLRRHLDQPAVRARRLLQRAGRRADFAADYTAGKAKYATTPAAMKGFEHGEEVFKAGYLNEDFAAAKFDDGLRMVATGEGAHYPMLTFAIGAIAAELSRQPQRCRLLRHARRRCRQERPDRLDAGRGLYPQDHPAPRGSQEVPRLRRQHRGLRRPQRRQRARPGRT